GLKGGINHTYGGEFDALPTVLNLLGVQDNDTVEFGSDLLSADHAQTVAFRNGYVATPAFTKAGSQYLNTPTGKKIDK
ncbi:glycerol phosphate lipoteichoic acid synthase, partial [Lactobacillus paracasei]|nr:glycerol phosphate lipoteichoic acid synthase [Lacticaseibacillus paracasei]